MSFLLKIYNSERIPIKNGILSVGRYYSRRSNSNSGSFYKVGTNDIEDELNTLNRDDEGGPNWEILRPKGNRFYLPQALGPAWQSPQSTIKGDVDLEKLIDFSSKESNKLHMSVKRCPTLMHDWSELFSKSELSNGAIITLYYPKHTEVENSAKNFVLAAREICLLLHAEDFWADFINPFSGKPFFESAPRSKLYKINERFRSFGVKFANLNNCLVITSEVDGPFSGNIFTNASDDIVRLTICINDPK